MNRLQALIVTRCDIKDCLENETYCLDDLQTEINKGNELKASCIVSGLMYMYKTQTVLDIHQHDDLVYGTYSDETYFFIAFKGSSNVSDFITNIKFIQKDDSFGIPGEIHGGFYNVLENRFHDIVNMMRGHETKKIIITGHSLGGALATILFSYFLVHHPSIQSNLYTFGSPRVGDKAFSTFVSESNRATRIVNRGDLVAMIPVFDYFHHDQKKSIGKTWWLPSIKSHMISEYLKNL